MALDYRRCVPLLPTLHHGQQDWLGAPTRRHGRQETMLLLRSPDARPAHCRFSRATTRSVRPDILEHWGRVGLADFETLITDALALTISEFETNPEMTWSATSFLQYFRDSLDLAYDVLVDKRGHGSAQQFSTNLQALVNVYLTRRTNPW